METLLTSLTEALGGGFILALLASYTWGVFSILLSPCHLSSIPLVIGFLTATQERQTKRGVLLALTFAVGIILTIAGIGLLTGALGRMLGDIGSFAKYAVALVLVVVGLYLMDVIRLPDTGVGLRPPGIRSPHLSALVLGLIFGIALGPCTFAFMAPVLGVVFQMSSRDLVGAGSLLFAFALGHCSVIVLAGGLASRVQAYLDWTNRSHAVLWTKRISGGIVILGAIYSVTVGF